MLEFCATLQPGIEHADLPVNERGIKANGQSVTAYSRFPNHSLIKSQRFEHLLDLEIVIAADHMQSFVRGAPSNIVCASLGNPGVGTLCMTKAVHGCETDAQRRGNKSRATHIDNQVRRVLVRPIPRGL